MDLSLDKNNYTFSSIKIQPAAIGVKSHELCIIISFPDRSGAAVSTILSGSAGLFLRYRPAECVLPSVPVRNRTHP